LSRVVCFPQHANLRKRFGAGGSRSHPSHLLPQEAASAFRFARSFSKLPIGRVPPSPPEGPRGVCCFRLSGASYGLAPPHLSPSYLRQRQEADIGVPPELVALGAPRHAVAPVVGRHLFDARHAAGMAGTASLPTCYRMGHRPRQTVLRLHLVTQLACLLDAAHKPRRRRHGMHCTQRHQEPVILAVARQAVAMQGSQSVDRRGRLHLRGRSRTLRRPRRREYAGAGPGPTSQEHSAAQENKPSHHGATPFPPDIGHRHAYVPGGWGEVRAGPAKSGLALATRRSIHRA